MKTTFPPPSVTQFAALAKEFCAWCEGESEDAVQLRTAAIWLARLYAAALELPYVEPGTDESESVQHAESEELGKRGLAGYWGQNYRQVFDPRPENNESPVMADLGDDLTGVYTDIKRSLAIYEAGNIKEAVWQWRFDLETHWGHHAVGALFGIHHLVVSGLG